MARYRCLEELRGNLLSEGDYVIFDFGDKWLEYVVRHDFLNTEENNAEIFRWLNVDPFDFCYRYYGYYPDSGDWPTCKYNDYLALTDVVNGLFSKIGEVRKSYPRGYDKSNVLRFKFI